MFQSSSQLPLSRALLWIFLSILITCALALLGWLYYSHLKELRLHDPRYRLIAMIQATPQQEVLKTVYLTEWLDLSIDKSVNLYAFDSKKAEQRLLASPLIKEATLKKIRPGILYVEYDMRQPIAYLGDYVNAALDEQGFLFPFSPFFTPKKLPIFYLGLSNKEKGWGEYLKNDERFQLACQVAQYLKDKKLQVKQVDVSKAFADSFGQRQIVVMLEDELDYQVDGKVDKVIKPYILRLSSEDYQQNLMNYHTLKAYLTSQIQKEAPVPSKDPIKTKLPVSIIDFRIPHLAFIKKGA